MNKFNPNLSVSPKYFLMITLICIMLLMVACSGEDELPLTVESYPTDLEVGTQPAVEESNPTEDPGVTTPPADTQPSPESSEPLQTEQSLQSPSIDTCLLLTQEEAAAALGKPVGEPLQESYPPIFSCTYISDDLDQVTIIVVEYESADAAAASVQMELDINNFEEVNGIGERAFRPLPVMDLSALIRNYQVSIDLATGDSEAEYLLARDLMDPALSRLP